MYLALLLSVMIRRQGRVGALICEAPMKGAGQGGGGGPSQSGCWEGTAFLPLCHPGVERSRKQRMCFHLSP